MAIAVAQVQQASQSATASSYPTAGLSITVAAGSYIYAVGVQEANGTNGISSVTDGTNTYTQFGSTLAMGGNGQIAQFYTGATGAGTYLVKVNFGATSIFPALFLAEITGSSGPDTSGTYFKSNYQSSVATGSDAITSTNLTPSTQPGLIIGVTIDANLSHTMAVGTGFTDLFPAATFWQFTTGTNRGSAEYKTYSSTSALAATWTLGSGNTAEGSVAALFVTGVSYVSPIYTNPLVQILAQ